jgi:hypothetical protein
VDRAAGALRIGPDDDVTEVTAAELRKVVGRLRAAGQRVDGDPPALIVTDSAGTWSGWPGYYGICRCPAEPVRADRVFYTRPARRARAVGVPAGTTTCSSCPTRHLVTPDAASTSVSARYGTVVNHAYGPCHRD